MEKTENLQSILYTGENVLDVLAFTGRHKKFGEWFNSDEDYVNYVKEHKGIFKMFTEHGTLECYPNTWIVRLPDGTCMPVGKPIHPDKKVCEDFNLKIDGKNYLESFDQSTQSLIKNIILATIDVCNEFHSDEHLFFYEAVAYKVFYWLVMGHIKRDEYYDFKNNCWTKYKEK